MVIKGNTYSIEKTASIKKINLVNFLVFGLFSFAMFVGAINMNDYSGKVFMFSIASILTCVMLFVYIKGIYNNTKIVSSIIIDENKIVFITFSNLFFKEKRIEYITYEITYEKEVFEKRLKGSIVTSGWRIITKKQDLFLIKEYFDEDLEKLLDI